MPRQPRYFIPDIPQHVIQRGVDRQAVFFRLADHELYLAALERAAREHDCLIHAYVLMTNHVHLLITPGKKQSLPLLMQAMGRRYVQALNKKYDRTGTLWEGRYKASPVQDDFYMLACHRYIELNPVRGGLAVAPGDYRWSSYAHNAHGRFDRLITEHRVYTALAATAIERRNAYRNLFRDAVDPEVLTDIREATNACQVLGNDAFRAQIATMLKRPVRARKRGRPRKSRASGEGAEEYSVRPHFSKT